MSLRKRILAASLAAVMTLGMTTGCSSVKQSDLSKDYSEIAAATYGSETIYLDEVNYYLRNAQLMYEYYGAMYGGSIWDTAGMEDSLREETMTEIFQTKVLCDQAESLGVSLTEDEMELVNETVDLALADPDSLFAKTAGVTKELITAITTENALANKVYYTIISEAEITVTEDDVRHNAVSYLLFTEEEEAEEETEAEAEEHDHKHFTIDDAQAALDELKAGTDIEALAEQYELEVTEDNLGVNDEQTSEYAKAAAALKEGESTMVYQEGQGWYVILCTSDYDEEATTSAYESAVNEAKEAHFAEVYEAIKKPEYKVNEKVVESLNIVDTPVLDLGTGEEETESDETESTEAE